MSDGLLGVRTPALLLDVGRLEANLARMSDRADRLGVGLRPHMKTAKSADVARLGRFGPITVSTLAEASYFASAGFDDILYGVAIAPARLADVSAIRRSGVDLQVTVDNPEAARAVESSDRMIPAWIEVDCDGRRGGVAPDGPLLLEVAGTLGDRRLRGVMTHAGGSYGARSALDLERWAEREREVVVMAAATLRDAGFKCPGVSVGSTPTATHATNLDGVTEMRPGVYMFGDTFQAGLGTCGWDDIACSVLTTVIGLRGTRSIIDAGALALSLDRSTAHEDHGFGAVADVDGVRIPDARVEHVTQEHGIVSVHRPVGHRLRVLPNHACITAACHDRYVVVRDEQVLDRWDRCRGW